MERTAPGQVADARVLAQVLLGAGHYHLLLEQLLIVGTCRLFVIVVYFHQLIGVPAAVLMHHFFNHLVPGAMLDGLCDRRARGLHGECLNLFELDGFLALRVLLVAIGHQMAQQCRVWFN